MSPHKKARIELARKQLSQASILAGRNGLTLVRRSDLHYQLRHNSEHWILNLYPSNQRIYRDPTKKAPFLRFPNPNEDWTLMDVIVSALKTGNPKCLIL
jgi:hypothetical protein